MSKSKGTMDLLADIGRFRPFAVLLLLAGPAAAQQQFCEGPGRAAAFCSVDGGSCACHFRRSDKSVLCDPAYPSCHGDPSQGAPFWPGDHIILTLRICNDGTQDPKECPHGDPANGDPWGFTDPAASRYYLENIEIVDRNGAGPSWDPANPDLFTFHEAVSGAHDGCAVNGQGDLTCTTNHPSAGPPPVYLRNGQCYALTASAVISLSHPCVPATVCNQASILDPLDPSPATPLMGCTSPPPMLGDGTETCHGLASCGTVDVSKTVIPPTFVPGDTLHYTLCITNTLAVSAMDILITDYLPDDPSDGVSWIDSTGGCVRSFSWDNPSFPSIQTNDLACALEDGPYFQIFGFDLGPTGSPTDHVCFAWDLQTSAATIPSTVTLCNPSPSPPSPESTVTWTGSPQPLVFGGDPASQACSTQSPAPSFAASTKSVDVPLALPGDPVNYHVEICNQGNASAMNFLFRDPLPDCFDLSAFDPATDVTVDDAALGGNTDVSWSPGTRTLTVAVTNGESFAAGDCLFVDVPLVVAASPLPTCENEGLMTWDGAPAPVRTSKAVFDTTPRAAILAVKELTAIQGAPPGLPAAAAPGQTLFYTITLTNQGTGTATDVTFHEPWPSGCIDASELEGLDDIRIQGSATTPDWTIDPVGYALDVSRMTIDPGAAVTIKINQTSSHHLFVDWGASGVDCCNLGDGTFVPAPGDPPISYQTTADASAPPPNSTCFRLLPPLPLAELTAAKSAGPSQALPGEPVGFQIVLRENQANGTDATDVTVTDVFDAGCLDFSAFTGSDVTVVGSSTFPTINWTPPTLTVKYLAVPSGGEVTVDINQQLGPALVVSGTAPAGACCDTATVDYTQRPFDPMSGKSIQTNDACVTVTISDPFVRREGVAVSACPLTGRPPIGAILSDGVSEAAIGALPYEDRYYRLAPWDAGSPPDNSCLVFYQHDDASPNRLRVVPGLASPAEDVRLEAQ